MTQISVLAPFTLDVNPKPFPSLAYKIIVNNCYKLTVLAQ